MAIDGFVLNCVLEDWACAPKGRKTQTVKKWAEKLGCTPKTLYGYINTGRKRKKGERRLKDIEAHAMTVHQLKRKCPAHHGLISTDLALEQAILSGLVPDELAGKEATINRVGREMGLHKTKRRTSRYQAEYPNQFHHVDASSSKFFFIHRLHGEDDFMLRMHDGTLGYKNKPIPVGLRPWVYGVVDDYSGVYTARYVAAEGEKMTDNIQFLCWAWARNESKRFFGLPDMIKGDKGPMMNSPGVKDFFKRLNINIDGSIPGHKEAHGKIERPWRTAWNRFEKTYFMQTDWKKFEVPLSELNRQFFNFQERENSKGHRYEKRVSKIEVWNRISLKGGAVAMPDNAISTIAKRDERTVGTDGCISLDGVIYEVMGLHDAKVWVFSGLFDDKVVVTDKATGISYKTKRFAPNPVGKYTAHQETPHQKAVKAAQDLEVTHTIYSHKKDAGNVVLLPTPVKETVELEDPLDTSTYPSMAEAMQDFISMSGVILLDKENREAIQEVILENGLSRQFVTDLALEIQVENHNRRISQ